MHVGVCANIADLYRVPGSAYRAALSSYNLVVRRILESDFSLWSMLNVHYGSMNKFSVLRSSREAEDWFTPKRQAAMM
jgi:hypothetical protein